MKLNVEAAKNLALATVVRRSPDPAPTLTEGLAFIPDNSDRAVRRNGPARKPAPNAVRQAYNPLGDTARRPLMAPGCI
jgi:hypothetical protein